MPDTKDQQKEQSSQDKTSVTASETSAKHKKSTDKKSHIKKSVNKSPGLLQLVGWFFVALILISAGGGYYLWEYVKTTKDDIVQDLSDSKTEVSLLAETLTSSESNLKNEINTLTTLQTELSDSVQALLSKSTHMRKDWLVSEAEYLVQLALNRLTLEGDIKTAIVALTNADARLLEAGDPGLHLLRQEISNTITTLKALPVLDVSGISMQISSVIQQINKLPLVTPDPESIKNSQQISHDKMSEDKPVNWKEVTTKVVSDLTSLIRIRKHDQIVQPLLTPEQSFYLTQNLKLQLEQARTALLHKQENTFHERLTESISWIEEYFDKSKTATQSAITILSNLNKTKLTQEIPDLSQALNMFTNFQAGIRLNKKSTKTSTQNKPIKDTPSKKQTETKKKITTKTKVIELKKVPVEKTKVPEKPPETSNDQKTIEKNNKDLVPVTPEIPGMSL